MLSIPYNGDEGLIHKIAKQNLIAHCEQIYVPMPDKLIKSCRVIKQSNNYDDEIINIIESSKKYNMRVNLLLNPGCLNTLMSSKYSIKPIINYLKFLFDNYSLGSITTSDYLLAGMIKKAIPKLKIEASCMANIKDVRIANYWVDLGTDVIVIHPDKNKDIKYIRDLAHYFPNIKLKMIVNELCIPNCPMRQGHSNLEGHGNSGESYHEACTSIFKNKPWLVYSSAYIPPKYLYLYNELIDIYKIVDRLSTSEKIIEAIAVYSNDIRYHAIKKDWDNRIPESVFHKVINCNKICNECDFCKKYFENISTEQFYPRQKRIKNGL